MIGSGTLTKNIAGYLARTAYDALNVEAVRATKEHILYTLGTILAGSSARGIEQAMVGAQALGGSQESTVLVYGDKLPAPSAALVNATMGHSEFNINDDRIAYKSSVTVIPAALAIAEKIGGVGGKDFIGAVCVGVDLGIRLGLATNPKPVHARAIALGPFAAACGKILGFYAASCRASPTRLSQASKPSSPSSPSKFPLRKSRTPRISSTPDFLKSWIAPAISMDFTAKRFRISLD